MGLYYHLSGEEKEFAKKKSLFCLIIYDIISNKRRLRLAKLLEGFGMRVQRSCFEVDLEKASSSYQLLLGARQNSYDAKQEDNNIIYVGSLEETVRLNGVRDQ
ncbi:CRISPR-associated endonuclease Cas2 [Streptococcus pneumoniae]|uniref:CRISPR-associated endoribonuclease Cas2 n=1 Tax=Streptococcus pneumoniae TaxID=1313 RepID=A0A558ZV93_STREE|nr:CRISPR-associated endonuclease Cas2 [Streptococcus pneumoniae]